MQVLSTHGSWYPFILYMTVLVSFVCVLYFINIHLPSMKDLRLPQLFTEAPPPPFLHGIKYPTSEDAGPGNNTLCMSERKESVENLLLRVLFSPHL